MPARRGRTIVITGATAVVLGAAGMVTAVVTNAADGDCEVSYAVATQWPGGFTGDIRVRNLGAPVRGWTLRWPFTGGQRIAQAWNATAKQDGTSVAVTHAGWNAAIDRDATVTFGFSASWNNVTNPAPTGFTLNGVACKDASKPTPTKPTPPKSTPSKPTPTKPTPPEPAPTTTKPATAPPARQQCADSASIDMGKYWINNNVWGKDSGSGNQCISAASMSGNSIAWSTSFNWSGQANTVKSYASSVLGWHWGVKRSGTGLPVQLSASRDITTKWNFRVAQDGAVTQNVSYDCWLHDKAHPSYNDQPTDELMIWLYRSNGAGPAGTKQATVTIGGATWDVYKGVVGTWNVYSYVRTTNTTSAALNIRDFTQDVVARGWMGKSKFLTSVEAGTEVFTGKGRVDTTSYSVDVR